MKKSTKISFLFFALSIILEIFSAYTHSRDLRLFVGVFIVLGLAFVIYSFKDFVNVNGYLLFKGDVIIEDALIKSVNNEYYLESDIEYLWIENSIFIKWQDTSRIKQFLLGFAAAMGGITSPYKKAQYYKFKLSQDSYSDEKSLEELIEFDDFKVVEKGFASQFYSKDTIMGMRSSVALGIILVLMLIVYILLQII